MPRFLILLSCLIWFSCYAEAASFSDQVASIRADKSIKCNANDLQAANSIVGAMWSCRKKSDQLMLFVTEKAEASGELMRVMFKAERALDKDFSKEQRVFIESVLRHFSPLGYKDLMISFFSCTDKKAKLDAYNLEFDCYQGAEIRSHAVMVYPR